MDLVDELLAVRDLEELKVRLREAVGRALLLDRHAVTYDSGQRLSIGKHILAPRPTNRRCRQRPAQVPQDR